MLSILFVNKQSHIGFFVAAFWKMKFLHIRRDLYPQLKLQLWMVWSAKDLSFYHFVCARSFQMVWTNNVSPAQPSAAIAKNHLHPKPHTPDINFFMPSISLNFIMYPFISFPFIHTYTIYNFISFHFHFCLWGYMAKKPFGVIEWSTRRIYSD